MPLHEKHFTLEEARATLPELRPIFRRVQELVATLRKRELESHRMQQLIRSNGQGSKHPEFGDVISELQGVVAKFAERGIEVKDLERGLIDFPHWRNGEEVYLCWLYGEEDILFWHAIEDGFAGRTPL